MPESVGCHISSPQVSGHGMNLGCLSLGKRYTPHVLLGEDTFGNVMGAVHVHVGGVCTCVCAGTKERAVVTSSLLLFSISLFFWNTRHCPVNWDSPHHITRARGFLGHDGWLQNGDMKQSGSFRGLLNPHARADESPPCPCKICFGFKNALRLNFNLDFNFNPFCYCRTI